MFQSTLPTRGSDIVLIAQGIKAVRVSIHAPHEGERQPSPPWRRRLKNVSIHAPHEGERHYRGGLDRPLIIVSIHAPHEGERQPSPPWRRRLKNVSIHAPHEGERPAGSAAIARATGSFNPRSPRGGATAGGLADLTRELFQSTLPTRGSDKAKYRPGASRTCFNPRSPRGGATTIGAA